MMIIIVFLIMEENTYLSKKVIEKVERLHKECYVKKYYLTGFNSSRSILINYRNCTEFLKQVSKEKFDIFFCGEEGSIINCFMMEYFKLKGTKVISCEILIRPKLHEDYSKKTKGFSPEETENASLCLRLMTAIKNREFHRIYKAIINLYLNVIFIHRPTA